MGERPGKKVGAVLIGAALLMTAACGANAAGSSKPKVIGVMELVASDQPIQRIMSAIDREAKAKGFTVKAIDANYNPQAEYTAVQTFVSQQVAGIINIAGDNSALSGAFRAAKAANIPVVSINAGNAVDGVTVNRDFPDTQLGATMANDFYSAISSIKVSNPVIIEQVLPEASPCLRRAVGFAQVIAKHPNVQVVKYHINSTNAAGDSSTYTSQYLATHPNVVGVLSCWDVPAVAAATAAKAAGKTASNFVVAGFNGTTPALQEMRKPGSLLAMTAGFADAAPAKGAVDDIAEVRSGGHPNPAPSEQTGVFTKSNMPSGNSIELNSWLPQGWPTVYWS